MNIVHQYGLLDNCRRVTPFKVTCPPMYSFPLTFVLGVLVPENGGEKVVKGQLIDSASNEDAWKSLRFWIFDSLGVEAPLEGRLAFLKDLFAQTDSQQIIFPYYSVIKVFVGLFPLSLSEFSQMRRLRRFWTRLQKERKQQLCGCVNRAPLTRESLQKHSWK